MGTQQSKIGNYPNGHTTTEKKTAPILNGLPAKKQKQMLFSCLALIP